MEYIYIFRSLDVIYRNVLLNIVKKINQKDDVTLWLQFEWWECHPTEILSKEHCRQREQRFQGQEVKWSRSPSVMSDSLQPHRLQPTRLPCPSLPPRVCLNSCPLSWWCHPIISSSVIPFSTCLLSFPALGSCPLSWLFTSGGQSIGASASAWVLSMNIQSWFSLGLTGLISLLSKGFSRVFFNTLVWKHQFFSAQPSLWSNSHIHTWLLEKP